jgi:extracellular elastinolytic metalloproteinase
VIKLGDVGPNGSNVKRLTVSAQLIPATGGNPANNRFTALRSFDAYTCRAGKNVGNPTCDGAIAAGWTKVVSSASDAFPSVNPRPVAPDLSLRSFVSEGPAMLARP